jgi:hypothetical protein
VFSVSPSGPLKNIWAAFGRYTLGWGQIKKFLKFWGKLQNLNGSQFRVHGWVK